MIMTTMGLHLALGVIFIFSISGVAESSSVPNCSNTTVGTCMADVLAFYPRIRFGYNITAPELDKYCRDVFTASGCLEAYGCPAGAEYQGILDSAVFVCTSPENKKTHLDHQRCLMFTEMRGENYIACYPSTAGCNETIDFITCGYYAYITYCGTDTSRLLIGYFTRLIQPAYDLINCDLGYAGYPFVCSPTTVTSCMQAVADFYPIITTAGNITATQLDNFCNDVYSASDCILQNGCDSTTTLATNEAMIDGWSYVCSYPPGYRQLFLDNQQCLITSQAQGGYKACSDRYNTSSCDDTRALAACGHAAYTTECGNTTARMWATYFIKTRQSLFEHDDCILDSVVNDGDEYGDLIDVTTTIPRPTTASPPTSTGNTINILKINFVVFLTILAASTHT